MLLLAKSRVPDEHKKDPLYSKLKQNWQRMAQFTATFSFCAIKYDLPDLILACCALFNCSFCLNPTWHSGFQHAMAASLLLQKLMLVLLAVCSNFSSKTQTCSKNKCEHACAKCWKQESGDTENLSILTHFPALNLQQWLDSTHSPSQMPYPQAVIFADNSVVILQDERNQVLTSHIWLDQVIFCQSFCEAKQKTLSNWRSQEAKLAFSQRGIRPMIFDLRHGKKSPDFPQMVLHVFWKKFLFSSARGLWTHFFRRLYFCLFAVSDLYSMAEFFSCHILFNRNGRMKSWLGIQKNSMDSRQCESHLISYGSRILYFTTGKLDFAKENGKGCEGWILSGTKSRSACMSWMAARIQLVGRRSSWPEMKSTIANEKQNQISPNEGAFMAEVVYTRKWKVWISLDALGPVKRCSSRVCTCQKESLFVCSLCL